VSTPSRSALLRGLLLIGLAAVTWGTTGSVTTVLVERAAATPLLIGAVRSWTAALLLAGVAVWTPGRLHVPAADRWRCLALGGSMAAFQACYFTAVTLSGIAITALIAICSAPIMIAGLAAALLGERVSGRVVVALGLGVTGTALLIVGPRAGGEFSARFVAGVGLALGAGLAYALYVVVAKSSVTRMAPLPVAAVTFIGAALLLTPVLAWQTAPARQIALGWPWLLYLGTVTTGAAYAMYTAGLRHVPAAIAGMASLLEPLTATLLGVLIFGERLGVPGLAGAALLLAALTIAVTAPPGGR
jgi:DME family drug/metabolite transporter